MANPWELNWQTGNAPVYGPPPTAQQAASTNSTNAGIPGTVAQGQITQAQVPYAGRKAAAEASKAEADAKAAWDKQNQADGNDQKIAAADEAARNLIIATERAKGLTNGWSTGGVGKFQNTWNPAVTDASRLHSVLEQQLRGNIFRNWVDSLKAQSDNGSTGIGRVLQSEIPLVTGAQGALDQFNMDAGDMKQSYDSIINGAIRSSALTHGEDPNDPKVFAHAFGRVMGTNSPNERLNYGLSVLQHNTANMSPAMQALARQMFYANPKTQQLLQQSRSTGSARSTGQATPSPKVIQYDANGNRIQ